jgi:glycosyltransferase involved in cell wall biosynthesis
MLIPDLLGTTPNFFTSEQRLVNVTHGYWVTSQELDDIYTALFPNRKPAGVLHDIPDLSLILKIRALRLKKSGLIWVGNSKWGSNYGFVDHKGYFEVVQPLEKRELPTHPFRIKDSAKMRIPNAEIIRKIAESEILIQTSAHEGTGLPLLEALGVGTVPITSDVGIAREVLTGELASLIADRSTAAFEHKIRIAAPLVNSLSVLCMSAFDSYIDKVKNERIRWNRSDIYFGAKEVNYFTTCRVHMIWRYRYYRSKWKR